MSFASSHWWWALLALSVPVIIHLFSRGRRQRIAIGSIRHLAEAESRALRRLRLTNWPLLLLRALALIALAWALAGPRSRLSGASSEDGTWVLIDPELLAMDGEESPALVDLLESMDLASIEADTVRILAPGLPEPPYETPLESAIDVWSLLKEADSLAPRRARFVVFTFDRVELLRGRRPHLSRQVAWEVIGDADANQWIELFAQPDVGTLTAIIGESSKSGTRFREATWSTTEVPPIGSGLVMPGNRDVVRLQSSDRIPEDDVVSVVASSAPLKVALTAAEDRASDAWYLRRAVEAVSRHTGRVLEWVDQAGTPVDLAIRLGMVDREPTAAKVLLEDSDPAYEACQGRVFPQGESRGSEMRLRRCSSALAGEAGVARWTDNWGRPFLLETRESSSAVYRLQSRFDPRWSDLVTTAALPRLLLSILEVATPGGVGAATSRSDRRAMTGFERIPGVAESSTRLEPDVSDFLELLVWLLVAVLLVGERLLAWRQA